MFGSLETYKNNNELTNSNAKFVFLKTKYIVYFSAQIAQKFLLRNRKTMLKSQLILSFQWQEGFL